MDDMKLLEKIEKLPIKFKDDLNDFLDCLLQKMDEEKPKPKFGSANGKIVLSEDFDEPLLGFEAYTE